MTWVTVEFVSRFRVDDRQLSALHAQAFGGDPAEVQPWSQRLERHALTWIGAFDAGRLVEFVQVCWDGGSHAFLPHLERFYLDACGFRATRAGLMALR